MSIRFYDSKGALIMTRPIAQHEGDYPSKTSVTGEETRFDLSMRLAGAVRAVVSFYDTYLDIAL